MHRRRSSRLPSATSSLLSSRPVASAAPPAQARRPESLAPPPRQLLARVQPWLRLDAGILARQLFFGPLDPLLVVVWGPVFAHHSGMAARRQSTTARCSSSSLRAAALHLPNASDEDHGDLKLFWPTTPAAPPLEQRTNGDGGCSLPHSVAALACIPLLFLFTKPAPTSSSLPIPGR